MVFCLCVFFLNINNFIELNIKYFILVSKLKIYKIFIVNDCLLLCVMRQQRNVLKWKLKIKISSIRTSLIRFFDYPDCNEDNLIENQNFNLIVTPVDLQYLTIPNYLRKLGKKTSMELRKHQSGVNIKRLLLSTTKHWGNQRENPTEGIL